MKLKRIDYDTMYDENTGNTETHMAVDERIHQTLTDETEQLAYEEGFAAASGVRPETAETGGRVRAPEGKDSPRINNKLVNNHSENGGLADS